MEFVGKNDLDPEIVILPIPLELTVCYGKGCKNGPAALIDASYHLETYDMETGVDIRKAKINTESVLELSDLPEQAASDIYRSAIRYVDKFLIGLGGEHSVSVSLVKAYKEKYPNLSVLQIDAHMDLMDEFEGSKFSHDCVMKRISEMGCRIVQAGIRSMSSEEHKAVLNREIDTKVYPAHMIQHDDDWYGDAVNSLTDNVYITIDLDALDPSIMPTTGVPEPGGMNWYQLIKLLRFVFRKKNVVGCDVVELAPIEGMKAPNYLAAMIVKKLIAYKLE